MNYRPFGKTDFKVSALGFGAMRLPILGSDYSKIDEEKAIEMLQYAMDNGINYIDTAYVYHGGNSEVVVGKALKGGYREKVKIATKLPVWQVNGLDDAERILDEQLKRLNTSYIDFYLLHALNKDHWKKLKEINIFKWIEKVLNEGKIKYIGFSFHDDLNTFKEIVDSYNWTFCQIQYNILNRNYQAGEEGLKYAASKGLAVVIMEPLLGGRLAKEPPHEIKQLWEKAHIKRTPVEWALAWLWNQKEVSVVLSGMSTLEQVKQNIEYASKYNIGCLTVEELELVEKVAQKYNELRKVNCTECKYCMPCPQGIDIPWNFNIYNQASMYNMFEEMKNDYLKKEKERAENCIECGVCETKCPQNLPIRKLLKEVAAYFSK
ncbi:aldo/keto reductase [Caldicellulosiruptor saccharolyticus DSM 8903]|uniref:Aldo/keto reductase n=1 Tax=Caldicellulosiruptor saccharolyticus (strain ATCC 43494 / DSM 8903 / Tp8T 6331) TaxID=351627 RepID=A4XJ51_CALS8|nr:aldo/keto reductase [Caldicellulosiruptor saccharolyticus]ABP66936.1 aldo/keto reductase [Caldicellulosiruptor saccharolyticus DSM 8903]